MFGVAKAARKSAAYTRTENGAVALNTTRDARLDLFGVIGALRGEKKARIERLFSEAYRMDTLFAMRYMALMHPEALRPNLDLIGVYGRYDDLYCLIGTPLENEMWAAMKAQFEEDRRNLEAGEAVSLLAKWIKTADASSARTRELGVLTARSLGYSVYEFKRIVRALRRRIGVIETLMSEGRWEEIRYPEVPSRAMMIYRNAFRRHDGERFAQFVRKQSMRVPCIPTTLWRKWLLDWGSAFIRLPL